MRSRRIGFAVAFVGAILGTRSASASNGPWTIASTHWTNWPPHPNDTLIGNTWYTQPNDQGYLYPNNNYFYTPSGAGNGKLLVFLSGSGGRPAQYTQFMQKAADAGYWVIGVDYLNDDSERDLCGCEAACYGALYQQLAVQNVDNGFYHYGSYWNYNGQSNAEFATHNSISNRLDVLLTWAENNTPLSANGGSKWATFHSNGAPVWSQIVMSGHSRGSDISFWLLKNRSVQAALVFSGVNAYLNMYPATSCWTPAGFRSSAKYCDPSQGGDTFAFPYIGYGGSTCSPQNAPATMIPSSSTPYPNLYLFDSLNDKFFNIGGGNVYTGPGDPDGGGLSQAQNASRMGFGGLTDSFELMSCPASLLTTQNRYLLDNTTHSSHVTTVLDNANSDISQADRACIWGRMLSLY